ncbi:MAG: long-chain fatty acid--CoA ligase [Mycobacteriales bacterium]
MKELSVPSRYTPGPQDLIVDDVFDNALKYPERVSIRRRVDDEWVPVTCLGLVDDIEALAAGLINAGIAPGERVALMSRTRYEWLLYDFAIMSIGAVTVPIYETSSAEQVEWILTDSGAVAAIVETDAQFATVDGLRARLPGLRDLWRVEEDRYRLIEAGFGVGREQTAQRRDTMGPESLATIVYTSGTTGRPKGCVLTHGNVLSLVRNVVSADGVYEKVFNERETTLLFLPLAHILARVIQFSALHAGVQLGHTDMSHVVEDLTSYRPTVVLSVPRVFEKLYNTARHTATASGKKRIFDRSETVAVAYSEALDRGGPSTALRLQHALFDRLVYRKVLAAMGGQVHWAVSGGAPLGAHLGHVFRGMGINVLEGYGLTETTAGGTLNLPDRQRVGSTGPPVPGSEIRIAQDGEILMKGPHVFSGYWQNDAATSEVMDEEGWFRTGDVGQLDDQGFLFITDRKKDLIVTSAGKNVAPAMLEDRLRAHWLVSQALVVGDARAYVGALLTVDEEAFVTWKAEHGKPEAAGPEAFVADRDFVGAVQEAVDSANASVSQAEAIKRWRVLPHDFTLEGGEVTPTLKLRRSLVTERYAKDVELLYS